MRATVYQHWKSSYERNLFNDRARAKAKLEDLQKGPILCTVCGRNVNENSIQEHLMIHSGEVEKGCRYSLDLPYKEANEEISKGAKYLRLYWIIAQGRYVPTLLNALLLPDWHKVIDANETTVRWSKVKSKFIRTFWALMIMYLFT